MTTEHENFNPPPLTIGDLTVPVPIIQGGMGIGVSMAGLASAVARSGGIGVIAAVMIGITEPDFHKAPHEATYRALKKQIKQAKENANGGVIGVNIMVALQDYDEVVKVAAEAGVDIIISGAGLPLKLPALLPSGCKTKLVPIVSSARAAQILCKRWLDHFNRLPDAVVVEGPEAGGHLGFKAEELTAEENRLENLTVAILEALKPFEEKAGRKIPMIVAGGVYTGADIHRFIKMGAAGVQMGTRFVATHECDASDAFKQAYLKATRDDVEIIVSPVGLPGRALKGPFIEKTKAGEKKPAVCVNKCLKTCNYKEVPYCISMALINAQRGNLNAGFVFCGSNVWRVDRIMSVRELVDELVEGYREAAREEAVGVSGKK